MKNLKVPFKLIIVILLFLNTFNILIAKNKDEFYDSKKISSYFSGVLAISDNQYQKSYDYLRSLSDLEDSHYNYSQYYLYSIVALKKFKEAKNYSQKLEKKKIDLIIANDVSNKDIGFDSEENEVTLITSSEELLLDRDSKKKISKKILEFISNNS